MSTMISMGETAKQTHSLPLKLWWRQIKAIFRFEVRKGFFNKRALIIYLLALMPVILLAAMAMFPFTARNLRSANSSIIFANIFEAVILRSMIFFGCAWTFMNLFRGELIDKSLHYYFLAPIRRELLVVGKYLSGLVMSSMIFVVAVSTSLFFLYLPRGYQASMDHIFNGPGGQQIFSYLSVCVLACVGYGAIFLLFGLFFRNPFIPALVIQLWESINFLLPPVLKKVSVIHYLESLMPLPISEGPFALVSEPTPVPIAVIGLIVLSIVLLLVAALRIRRMEISYGSE